MKPIFICGAICGILACLGLALKTRNSQVNFSHANENRLGTLAINPTISDQIGIGETGSDIQPEAQNINVLPNYSNQYEVGSQSATRLSKRPTIALSKKEVKFLSINDSIESLAKFVQDPSNDGQSLMAAVNFIGLNGRGNPEAANALIDFAQQPVQWARWDDTDLHARDQALARSRALDALGSTGTDEAKAFLLKALSNEGSHELAKPWIRNIPTFKNHVTDPDRLFPLFQGMASLGLAYYSDDPAIRDLILETNRRAMQSNTSLRGTSSDAVIRMKLILDLGVEGYLKAVRERGDTALMEEAITGRRRPAR